MGDSTCQCCGSVRGSTGYCLAWSHGEDCDSVIIGGDIVTLGHAIRRFARRAEVEGLVKAVDWRMEHGPACAYAVGRSVFTRPCDCGLGDSQDALDRLAALALEPSDV